MKLDRLAEMSIRGALGMALIVALMGTLLLLCIMGALLIPYNIARFIAWVFEKMIDGIAFIVSSIENRI